MNKSKTVTFRADPEVFEKFKSTIKKNGAKSVTAVLEFLMIAYGNEQIDVRPVKPVKKVDLIVNENVN